MSHGAPRSGIGLYEQMGERTTQPFAVQVLDGLGSISGMSIIDVAAGTGGLALVAAKRGAHVVATDLNPAMVDRAKERLRPFEKCRAQIMDCHIDLRSPRLFDLAPGYCRDDSRRPARRPDRSCNVDSPG